MTQLLSLDGCIYLALLFCVGAPWLFVTLGLRGNVRSMVSFHEDAGHGMRR
jgi:hypothetical protein